MLICLDFETFYDKAFSLTKLTTEEYVRDAQFEVIGVGVKVDEGPTAWFSGTFEETKTWLEQFDWANSLALAHNAMFDAAILTWRFGIKPKGWLDTLCMARAVHGTDVGNSLAKLSEYYELGAKGTEVVAAMGKRRGDFSTQELAQYGGYCKNDVELTYKLFTCLVEHFESGELKLIDLTVRMFSEPVLELDLPILEQHLEEVKDKKQKLLDSCTAELDTLMSNQKFADKLRELGVDPPMKFSPTTGKEAYAFAKTDEGFKELLEHPSEEVQALVAARLGNKTTLEETRTQRFIDISKRGALPVPLKYYAARTGRWGGCLVADTEVTVYNSANGVEAKNIVDVLLDDLVWDGEAFVPHDGVVFSGYQEVIFWDEIRGTKDHVVYTPNGPISLFEAMQGNHRITVARRPDENDVEAAREFIRNNESKDSM
jgi:hypothetical protein